MDLANKARAALEEKQGADISLWDVREHSQITDYYIVVTGTSPPHLKALFNGVQAALKHGEGMHCYRRAGDVESGWLVLDYLNVVIHIFLAENREYYAIEDLWQGAPLLK